MGRHCRQLLDTGRMEESIGRDGRIDLFWIDSLLEFPGVDSGEPLDTAAISCVLVNLDRSDESVAALRGLSQSLNGVRVTLQGIGSADVASSISAALALRFDDFASAIVWLDAATAKACETQRVVDALLRNRRDATGLVTIFSMGQATFDEQQGVDGYLTSREPHGAAAAAQLLAALGSMAAPVLMTCLDAEDIRPSLGDHRHPARLVQAVWSPIHHTLKFECGGDRQILRLSKRVAAFIFTSATTGAPIRSLVQSLRDAAPAAESFVYQISDGFRTSQNATPADAMQLTLLLWGS